MAKRGKLKKAVKEGPGNAVNVSPAGGTVPIPGTAGMKEAKKASRAQRVARVEKKNCRV